MHQARLVRLPVHVVRELNQVLKARRALEADASQAATADRQPCASRTSPRAGPAGAGGEPTCSSFAETPTSLDAPLDRARRRQRRESMLDSVADDGAIDPMA